MAEKQPNESTGVTTTISHPEPWLCVVKAEVARVVFDKEYAQRLKQAVRGHQQPGYRKGRTPKAVVEKAKGDMLRAEAVEALIPRAWMVAVMEHKLAPLTDPTLENFKFDEGEPLTFDLKVEVKPEIELADYDGLAVKRREVEVADKDVDEVVERLQESRAEFQVADREAAAEDRLTLDLVPLAADGEPDEAKLIADQTFILGADSNLPVFNEDLLGVKAGEERDVTVIYPDDHPNEQLRGETVAFRCRLKEVAAKILPEVDDAFAGAVEEGRTLLELRTNIRADLQKELERQVAAEMDQQALAELIDRNDVSLPPSMVGKYLESGLEELHRRNLQTGRQNTPEEDEQYRELGKPHAESALCGMLLMEALRRQEDIKVEPADVDERIEEIATEQGFEVDRYREFVNSGDDRSRIEYDLLERKAYDFLLSRANIETVPGDTDVLKEKE